MEGGEVAASRRFYSLFFRKYELLIEFKNLQNSKLPLGMYVTPSLDDIYIWHGTVFVHSGFYSGGVFKFTLKIPQDYPDSPPGLFVNSRLYHPLVDPKTRQFDLRHQFRQWRPLKDYICHVLIYFRKSFGENVLQSLQESLCADKDALHLFITNRELFSQKAKNSAKLSVTDAPNDASGINFTQINPQAEKEALEQIFKETTPIAVSNLTLPSLPLRTTSTSS